MICVYKNVVKELTISHIKAKKKKYKKKLWLGVA